MKETTLAKILAVACGLGLATALAQTSTTVTTTKDAAAGTAVTETSTTNASGTIRTYTPGTDYFTFESRGTTGAPVRYYYNRETTVLDSEGHVVTWSAVRPDVPATVYYVRDGDRMIVRKVVLSNPAVIEKETTTTTTTTNKR
jgi:hypothetical protein